MKAIGIKMVDLQSMTANEAIEKGYKTNNYTGEEKGYEVLIQIAINLGRQKLLLIRLILN